MIVIVTILVILLDQLSKVLFSRILTPNQTIPVIKNLFHFTLVHNTGIAFGMLKGGFKIILIFTVMGLVLIIYSLRKEFLSGSYSLNARRISSIDKLAFGFIIGGAIANMIDRLRLGYVVDFLDFRIWPVFNLADSCISIGAIILLWKLVLPSKRSRE